MQLTRVDTAPGFGPARGEAEDRAGTPGSRRLGSGALPAPHAAPPGTGRARARDGASLRAPRRPRPPARSGVGSPRGRGGRGAVWPGPSNGSGLTGPHHRLRTKATSAPPARTGTSTGTAGPGGIAACRDSAQPRSGERGSEEEAAAAEGT